MKASTTKETKIRPANLLDYSPETLAQIFSIIDYDMFQLINPRECLNKVCVHFMFFFELAVFLFLIYSFAIPFFCLM